MTTDLVTYYGQTPTIDQLVENYGAYLKKLDRETKLLLRTVLTNYVFMRERHEPSSYTLIEASRDALFVTFIGMDTPQVLVDICSQLKGLTPDEAETILSALQHQIRWGNAQKLVN
ncbi:hypothetical protein PQG02_31745 (plasmid) [Nostoc sp. UHCC 0926]|uniref:hypothetical protein n=1 Tax=Nostoc sp. UHCC 0926 TaxID=3025190 RepID=UPI0023611C5A|nr:hypothetical protein [Nostoc sp. UHCC 0926]WDD35981.1 hypothetical protein PQG02_31745 [Nostoc sp. UHCC 0926]